MKRNNFLNLLFYLILERENPKSFWKPYFDILPQSFEHLPMMDEKAMDELKGLLLWKQMKKYKETVEIKYNNLEKRIFRVFNQHFHHRMFNYQNFLWATLILDSRSIWINGRRHLIPVLDMINCCGDTFK